MHGTPESIVTTSQLSLKRPGELLECCTVMIEDLSEDQFSSRASSGDGPKRRRYSTYEEDTELEIDFTDSSLPSPSGSTQSLPLPPITIRTVVPGRRMSWNGDDWDNVKSLYASAVELYEREANIDALDLLRQVIEECHECLLVHKDPSILFVPQPISPMSDSPGGFTPLDERLSRDWGTEYRPKESTPPIVESELPTAFHTVLGTSLLLYGNLITRETSAERSVQRYGRDWSCPAYFYWSLALDIFSAAHCLRHPTMDSSKSPPVDWEMSIARGRTLLRLANEVNSRTRQFPCRSDSSFSSYTSPILMEEPSWPKNSLFSTIMSRRPPGASSFRFTTAHDLMTDAWDLLSHGILFMPRRRKYPTPPPPSPPASGTVMEPPSFAAESLSLSMCAKQLYTIGTEVLSVAEQFRLPSERQQWAASADSIFSKVKIEDASERQWQGPITLARVKCWTVILDDAWDRDVPGVDDKGQLDALSLCSDEVEEARNALSVAISHLERAQCSVPLPSNLDFHRRDLLAKALAGLSKLSVDQSKRSEFCAKAQAEREHYLKLGWGGSGRERETESMDMTA